MQNTLENVQISFPKSRIEMLHAKMKNSEIESVIKKFFEKNIDVLIATTIIESGVDLPTANTIIVMNSERFGLSDLHQIRGRVGRSNIQAYCYFLTENFSEKSNNRLEILEKYKDLGDSFDISTKDLDHRGAGDLFGTAQSGFICDVGFDVYFEILKQTVDEIQKKSL
jgi:transcription-repair coupling factor (superfamily II helicase)